MKIGIIGARVSGSYAALLLSRLGHEVVLFDESVEKEKPCGGGVTAKALRRMNWLHEPPLLHTEISSIRMMDDGGYISDLRLRRPMRLYSRLSIESSLRQRATDAGARFQPERVTKLSADHSGWAIETRSGAAGVDFVVGADGVKSLVRTQLVGRYSSADLSLALGYNLPEIFDPGAMLIRFQESGFCGYIWSFPRLDGTSVGIGQWLPGAHPADLRARVERFISDRYPAAGAERRFYAARIPNLSSKSLIGQRVCGRNWALVGDAAGFADAITSEGIYYALRSAELLTEAIRGGNPAGYEVGWRSDFGADLESAAFWRNRFYGSIVLSRTFIRRSLQAVRYSPTVRRLLDDLLDGSISYSSLFRNLVLRSPTILLQAFRNKALTAKTQP